MATITLESLSDRVATALLRRYPGVRGAVGYGAVNLGGWVLQHHKQDVQRIIDHIPIFRSSQHPSRDREAIEQSIHNMLHEKTDALAHIILGSKAHEVEKLLGIKKDD